MKNLSLIKTVSFFLLLSIVVLLIVDKMMDFGTVETAGKKIIAFYLYKDIVFLIVTATVIYFSISFYRKRYQNNELNYQKLFNGSPLPMYIMTKDSLKIIAVNEAMTKLYGYSASEFLTMTAFDIRSDEENDKIADFLNQYGALINDSGTWLHQKRNGEQFYVQITFHSVPLATEDGYLVMITDIDKSITDEKRISDLLHLYQTVNKATNDVIWDYDLVGDKLNWMQGYTDAYGYDKEAVSNSFWAMKNIHIDDRTRVQDEFKNVVRQKQKDWFAEYRYICADGTIKFVRDRGYMIFDQSGEPTRMIGAMQDVDKQKKYEYQLLNQNEQLKEIAWINSHEVRRPLSNILGLIGLIKDVAKNPEVIQLIELLSVSSKELEDAVTRINRQTAETNADHPSNQDI